MVYVIKITDVVQLKQPVIGCWNEIPQEEISRYKSKQRTYWTI